MLNAKTACIAILFTLGATSFAAAQGSVTRGAASVSHLAHSKTFRAPVQEGRSVAVAPAVDSTPVENSLNFLGFSGTNAPGR